MTTSSTPTRHHRTPAALLTPLRERQILVLADHSPHVTALVLQLSADDVEVVLVRSAEMARVRLKGKSPAAVLVCPELGEQSGYAAVETLQAGGVLAPECPVIAFSARADGVDRLRAFQRGCLDFVALPIFYPELAARLQVAIARPVPLRSELVVPGGLRIDLLSQSVWVGGQMVELSPLQYALTVRLSREPTRMCGKDELLREVWGFRSKGRTRTLDSHACRLRTKLREANPGGYGYVHNIWSKGYSMVRAGDLNL